jgi:cation:H+ antiporter
MEIILWVLVLGVALVTLVGGADLFLKNAERIGLAIGISSFTIGVIVVGFGTSLPELASGILAILRDVPTIVPANAIGSNIANILLIGGVLAFVGKKLTIDRDLLSAELPFFVISTTLFAEIAYDAQVTTLESVLLVGTLIVYFFYLFSEDYSSGMVVEAVKDEVQKERFQLFHPSNTRTIALLVSGLALLLVGAHYVVESVVAIAGILSVPPGAVSITALAFGTSLPELVVSIKAVSSNKLSLAIGNIFGSNAFNILIAVGVPGLFMTLPLDDPTYQVGLPVLITSSVILLVIGLARKLYRWEGIMFFVLYGFFIIQLIAHCCDITI